MRTVYLTWRDPQTRLWFVVGRLTSNHQRYSFTYTQGVAQALKAGFRLLPSFPEIGQAYESSHLFPVFSNRLLQTRRPDYHEYLSWLDITEAEPHPLTILSRSEGKKYTDYMEILPTPERNEAGEYEVCFFLRGLSQMPPGAIERARSLENGERLLAMRDFQNPHDDRALALRTGDGPGGIFIVGYCPRLLGDDVLELMKEPGNNPLVTVARVNQPPAPSDFRVLCKLTMSWPEGFVPFSGPEYQTIVPSHGEQPKVA